MDSRTSSHEFDDTITPALRYRLDNYQELATRRWVITGEGHQLKKADQGLLGGHSIGTQELKRLIQLPVLAEPDVGRNLFSAKQDGAALSGGKSLPGTLEVCKPREKPASLGEASPAGGVPQDGVLEHPEQPMLPGCEHVEAPLAGSFATPTPRTFASPSDASGNGGRQRNAVHQRC